MAIIPLFENAGSEPPEPPMELSERVSKIESTLQTLASREDLYKETGTLRAEMHKEFTAQTWKIIGFFTTISGALVGITYYIAKL
jgi:hypothetical protein